VSLFQGRRDELVNGLFALKIGFALRPLLSGVAVQSLSDGAVCFLCHTRQRYALRTSREPRRWSAIRLAAAQPDAGD
jgi:hypothetical protein